MSDSKSTTVVEDDGHGKLAKPAKSRKQRSNKLAAQQRLKELEDSDDMIAGSDEHSSNSSDDSSASRKKGKKKKKAIKKNSNNNSRKRSRSKKTPSPATTQTDSGDVTAASVKTKQEPDVSASSETGKPKKKRVKKNKDGGEGEEEGKEPKKTPRRRKARKSDDASDSGELKEGVAPKYPTTFNIDYQTAKNKFPMRRKNVIKRRANAARLAEVICKEIGPMIRQLVGNNNSSSSNASSSSSSPLDHLDLSSVYEAMKALVYTKKSKDTDDPQRSVTLQSIKQILELLGNTFLTQASVRAHRNERLKTRNRVGDYYMDSPGFAYFMHGDSIETIGNRETRNNFLKRTLGEIIDGIFVSTNKDSEALPKDFRRWTVRDFITAGLRNTCAETVSILESRMEMAEKRTEPPTLLWKDMKIIANHLERHQDTLAGCVPGIMLLIEVIDRFDKTFPSKGRITSANNGNPIGTTSTSKPNNTKKNNKKKRTPAKEEEESEDKSEEEEEEAEESSEEDEEEEAEDESEEEENDDDGVVPTGKPAVPGVSNANRIINKDEESEENDDDDGDDDEEDEKKPATLKRTESVLSLPADA